MSIGEYRRAARNIGSIFEIEELFIMKNMYNFIVRTAIDYTHVQTEEVVDLFVQQEDALVEVDFCTEWMSYTCYVDIGGAVMGFMSSPMDENEAIPVQLGIDTLCA